MCVEVVESFRTNVQAEKRKNQKKRKEEKRGRLNSQ